MVYFYIFVLVQNPPHFFSALLFHAKFLLWLFCMIRCHRQLKGIKISLTTYTTDNNKNEQKKKKPITAPSDAVYGFLFILLINIINIIE